MSYISEDCFFLMNLLDKSRNINASILICYLYTKNVACHKMYKIILRGGYMDKWGGFIEQFCSIKLLNKIENSMEDMKFLAADM